MAKAKKIVKPDFTKGKLHDAIVADVAGRIAGASTFRATWHRYIKMCSDGATNFTPDNAEALLLAINTEIVRVRRDAKDFREPAKPNTAKISETKSILRMHKWQCVDDLFNDKLKGLDVSEGGRGLNHGSLVIIARKLKEKKKDGGLEWKPERTDAPPRDLLLRAIEKRRKAKGGERLKPHEKPVTDPIAAAKEIKSYTTMLAKWFGRDKNGTARYFDTMTKALDAITAAAKPLAAKRAEAEAAAE
jgi:hypothetical protein